jgi:hypothetical protein
VRGVTIEQKPRERRRSEMTTPRIEKIGLVAHYSEVGNWTFETALAIACQRRIVLNVFSFLESPYEASLDTAPGDAPIRRYAKRTLVEKDRELREYYDDRLGDFIDAGFRVCESGRHNLELRSCLKRKEFQILLIPYLEYGVPFGNMPIEEFAYRFNAPILLVGPESPDQYHLNPPGEVLSRSLDLEITDWKSIQEPTRYQELPVI